MSIRGRLLLILLVGLAIALAAGGALIYTIEAVSMRDQFDSQLQSRAHTLASLVKYEPGELVFETGDAPAMTLDETFFEVRTRSGELLKRSLNLKETALPQYEPSDSALIYKDVALPNDTRGRAAWLAFRPRVDPDDWEGIDLSEAQPEPLVVVVALDRAPVDSAQTTLLRTLAGVGTLVAATVCLTIMLGVRWGLAPLRRLAGQLESIDGNSHLQRIDGHCAAREIAPVYRELNAMLERVERTLERERSFAGAAAHELRTPLAELRSTAEIALRWPETDRSHQALTEALAIGREMEILVESLLLISRGVSLSTAGPAAGAAVKPIVERCLADSRGAIDARNVSIDVDLDDSSTLPGSTEALEIIIRNLLSNAIQYTDDEGSIWVRGQQLNGWGFAVSIENGPVDLKLADLSQLFQPFWRNDGARTDRTHVGLGLTVVQRVANAIGLRVDATLNQNRLSMSLLRSGSATPSDGNRT